MVSKAVVWLRNDLRIGDNPALDAALARGGSVTAVYIHETDNHLRKPGAAVQWWLEQSLANFCKRLETLGVTLIVETGKSADILTKLAKEVKPEVVFWNRRYAPTERECDAQIKTELRQSGFTVTSFSGNLLLEPWQLETGSGGPYQVFTPFARSLRQKGVPTPLRLRETKAQSSSAKHKSYERPSPPHWAEKMEGSWKIGEEAGYEQFHDFLDDIVKSYAESRDVPGKLGTSRLSPYLRFGEVSVRQLWHSALHYGEQHPAVSSGVEKFLSELIWRDFHYHQLYHRKDIARYDMRNAIAHIEWQEDKKALSAWTKGQTGFPIVDAGMRQLWATGWMHNRVRMLVASLLTKNLLIDWRHGEEWFWDTLVDGDIASNPGSWQWVAGCGMDAAPYFRVFNPVVQGERFDAAGDYVREWVPELADMPNKWIHKPFEAPDTVLEKAGVVLGKTYPKPIVDLKSSSRRARNSKKGEEDDLFA